VEFDLLVALARRAGRVVSRDALLGRPAATTPWWASAPSTSTSPTCARSSATTRATPRRIKTLRGVGYVLVRDEEG
jgi:two-component system OmpR family response regulator